MNIARDLPNGLAEVEKRARIASVQGVTSGNFKRVRRASSCRSGAS